MCNTTWWNVLVTFSVSDRWYKNMRLCFRPPAIVSTAVCGTCASTAKCRRSSRTTTQCHSVSIREALRRHSTEGVSGTCTRSAVVSLIPEQPMHGVVRRLRLYRCADFCKKCIQNGWDVRRCRCLNRRKVCPSDASCSMIMKSEFVVSRPRRRVSRTLDLRCIWSWIANQRSLSHFWG